MVSPPRNGLVVEEEVVGRKEGWLVRSPDAEADVVMRANAATLSLLHLLCRKCGSEMLQ